MACIFSMHTCSACVKHRGVVRREHNPAPRHVSVRATRQEGTERPIKNLKQDEYCDEFVCNSSPAVELCVRGLGKAIERQGAWTPNLFAENVKYTVRPPGQTSGRAINCVVVLFPIGCLQGLLGRGSALRMQDGSRTFTGRAGYTTLTWWQDNVESYEAVRAVSLHSRAQGRCTRGLAGRSFRTWVAPQTHIVLYQSIQGGSLQVQFTALLALSCNRLGCLVAIQADNHLSPPANGC